MQDNTCLMIYSSLLLHNREEGNSLDVAGISSRIAHFYFSLLTWKPDTQQLNAEPSPPTKATSPNENKETPDHGQVEHIIRSIIICL